MHQAVWQSRCGTRLTTGTPRSIVARMESISETEAEISVQDLLALESRVEELINACAILRRENHQLRDKQQQLLVERATLLEQTQQARARVEGMIDRLKSLETGS